MTTPSTQPPEKVRLKPQSCPRCEGLVVPTSKDGRFLPFKDVLINLPMSVYIPTCMSCGVRILTEEVELEIDVALAASYAVHEVDIAKAVERLKRRKGLN